MIRSLLPVAVSPVALGLVAPLLVGGLCAGAQRSIVHEQELVAESPSPDDGLGTVVAVSGPTAVVGAPDADTAGVGADAGAAIVFARPVGSAASWTQVVRLAGDDTQAGDLFGSSVAIDGDTIVVGAQEEDEAGADAGAAYVFRRGGTGTWSQVAKLSASDAAPGDNLGWSVSLSGDRALVAAIFAGTTGVVYVFERDAGGPEAWGEVARLTASDAGEADRFGRGLTLRGDVALVGADGNDDAGSSSGAAYLFDRDQGGAGNWGEVTKLTASDAAAVDHFGIAVAVEGEVVCVAAHRDDDLGTESGSVYVFLRDHGGPGNWGELTKVQASDGTENDFFGRSIALQRGRLVVGAFGQDAGGPDAGAVYVFDRDRGGSDGWGEVAQLLAPAGAPGDWMGFGVAFDRRTIVAGAPEADAGEADAGAAHVFVAPKPALAQGPPEPAPGVLLLRSGSTRPTGGWTVVLEGVRPDAVAALLLARIEGEADATAVALRPLVGGAATFRVMPPTDEVLRGRSLTLRAQVLRGGRTMETEPLRVRP